MKRLVLLSTAVLLSAPQAFASKARLQSLQRAYFVKDSQTIFSNPAHVNSLGKYLTFEFGGTGNTSAPKAEGGIFTQEFGANVGVYMGHVSANQTSLRALGGYENQNNPVEFFYARDTWGASVSLSNFENKNTSVKEQTAILRWGMDNNGQEFFVTAEVLANAEAAGAKYQGSPYLTAGYEKEMDKNYFVVNATFGNTKQDITGTSVDVKDAGAEIGLLSRKIENIYYGAFLSWAQREVTAGKIQAMTLPMVIGIEAPVTSWATFRGSVTQSLLLSSVKDGTAGAGADQDIIDTNDTQVAAGVGIKYNNFTLDGVVAASSTGNMNGNDVLTSASVTYNF